jgi:hypothetical protein
MEKEPLMKTALFVLPLALAFAANAYAVDPIEKQVTVTATIPTEAFFVEPVGGNWMNDPQDMNWNSYQQTLQPIRKQLQVKSTTGAISAYLLHPAVMTGGAGNIGLDVSVNGTPLKLTPDPVVPAPQAAAGATVEFLIAAQAANTADGKYLPGNYQGVINMMFETVTP